jgi:hypothetical protein
MDIQSEKELAKETVVKSGTAGRLIVMIILFALLAIAVIGVIRLLT